MLARTLMFLAAALPAAAQTTTPRPPLTQTGMARAMWESVRKDVTRAATGVPDSLYDYRPTPDVRTFGELISHVASSQDGYCLIALGGKPPEESASGMGAKGKAGIVAALAASNDVCVRAYAQTDEATAGSANGTAQSRLRMLYENAMHDSEHYGNIVTYMRLNHMVPPSSLPATKP
jgi:hypothetical protein